MLDAKAKFSEIRKHFEDDPKNQTFNALVCGEMGTGKTHLLKTCRKPVLLHTFDPGGYVTVRDEMKRGEIIVESFAPDNPMQPWAYQTWVRTMEQRIREGIFEHIGTFALDSSTLWAETILYNLVAKRGKAGATPEGKLDYLPQKTEIRNWITRILALPCDVIVTGHLEPTEDLVTGRVTYRYATTGKGTFIIPAMFDEVYVAVAEETSKGVSYKLITAGAGRYAARSRLASGGKIDQYEDPDIKAILRKAGYPVEDKPLFT